MCSALRSTSPLEHILHDDLSIDRYHWITYNPPLAVAPPEEGTAITGLSVGVLISLVQDGKWV
jgi:hypothetical protein